MNPVDTYCFVVGEITRDGGGYDARIVLDAIEDDPSIIPTLKKWAKQNVEIQAAEAGNKTAWRLRDLMLALCDRGLI